MGEKDSTLNEDDVIYSFKNFKFSFLIALIKMILSYIIVRLIYTTKIEM